MIQRRQSLYLLLAAIVMLLFYLFPIAVFHTDTFSFTFFSYHITHPENMMPPPVALFPLATLPLISILLSSYSIFKFMNRRLQMRLGKINLMITAFVVVFMVFFLFRLHTMMNGTFSLGFAGVLPLISGALIFMANKSIRRDDDLVRSADRIR